ncbi:MAG TPA: TadG family pilus assembly protein, partial [Gemmatales bacterium]|nr:TadG family pilus assembly protein [Gemmatales bacterium]
MHLRSNRTPRRGAFVVFLAACLIMLVAMLALAIDLGVMMVARNQCQNAADIASLAGARRLTGDYTIDYNKDEALPAAQAAATQNNILQRPIDAGQVSITVGSYGYNQTTQQFEIFPDTRYSDNDGWSLVRATVVNSSPSYFARVFGTSTLDVQAVATATHRPRDVALVVDFSGSMRLGSVLGAPITGMSGGSLQIVNRTMSMNADVFPRYGHYTSMISSMTGQGAQTTPTGEMIDRANLTIEAPGDTAGVYLCNNFFQDSDIRDYTQPAFTRSSSSDTSPNGDVDPGRYSVAHHLGLTAAPTTPQQPPPLTPTLPGGTPQARPSGIPTYWPPTSVYIFPNTPPVTAYTRHTWENTGYSNFQGFTEGPSFWGKTFWIWPPDPRFNTGSPLSIAADNGHNDWRKRFFIQVFLGRTTTTSNRGPQPSGGGGGGGGSRGGGGGGG